ncbi:MULTISPECIES: hypothetical protein [Marinobacter]|uniref:Uncharacterized protein n=1 Tax=Marinobacter xiaoshiensis TaxID=3073652 RepID=A0ABU2HJ30_9GAMM|nr:MULTISPECIES: hypothetical protein [unclassified Marinobacter]MBK1888292.1 hypothetical protein [Marinobacter sp. DY40_1A1]MDS1310768.1 hypothetical protein [Marinobacter sp. F60267]
MTLITLNRPVRSDHRLERIHMFPGRHLGEQELDRQQAWADARLSQLLVHCHPGIVNGLTLADESLDSLTITPGLAVAGNGKTIHLYSELKTSWQALIDQYLEPLATGDATGVYYLTLSQSLRHVDSPQVEPCQRSEFDPTRDAQLITVTTLALRRLAIKGISARDQPRSLIENRVASTGVTAALLHEHPDSIPLAVVCIDPGASEESPVRWVSPATGRYRAIPNSGYRVLLEQTSTAINRAMERFAARELAESDDQHAFLRENLALDYLPSAGQFPVSWLRNPNTGEAKLDWLPAHLAVDMVPVPEARIPDLILRNLPGPPISLHTPRGERLRLLLALKAADYRPDLLDIPPTDKRLEDDLFRYHMHAHKAWMHWKSQFYRLYYIVILPSHQPSGDTSEEEGELEPIIHDPSKLGDLGLPKPDGPPVAPKLFFTELRNNAKGSPEAPVYPYDQFGQEGPDGPEDYKAWLGHEGDSENQSPEPAKPKDDGLVVRYAALLVDIEETRNQIRDLTSRGGRLRDFLLLQRQQLDVQSASMSALANGVAPGDNATKGKGTLQYSYALTPDTYSLATTAQNTQRITQQIKKYQQSGAFKNASMELLERSAVKQATAQKDRLLRKNPDNTSTFEIMAQTHGQPLAPLAGAIPVVKQAFPSSVSGFTVMEDASPATAQYQKNHAKLLELSTLAHQQLAKGDANSIYKLLKADKLIDPGKLDLNKDDVKDIIKDQYDALLDAGKALTGWIKGTESRFNNLERRREAKISQLTRMEAEAKKLSASIRIAREQLDNLSQTLDECKGDYSVAQQLLMEDWERVQARNEERTRILTTGIRGLYYVRVRSAETSLPPADPLQLRFRQGNDKMPACNPENLLELPETLAGFMDAVTEIPLADWGALKHLIPQIQPGWKMSFADRFRKVRFDSKRQNTKRGNLPAILESRMGSLRMSNQALLINWSQGFIPAKSNSLRQEQKETAKILALDDVSNIQSGALRKAAETLRDDLELAQRCLLQHLRGLSGSLRLTWGQLAEDDRLPAADVNRWPGLERAEQEDFNRVRTLSELVDWWFRQLTDEPSPNSRQAMENMIRATLIVASLGDPEDIIRGAVTAPPRLVRLGERLKVRLNRAPLPGMELQLLDEMQRVTAILTVEDQVADSTEVRISRVLQKDIHISTRSKVTGKVRR